MVYIIIRFIYLVNNNYIKNTKQYERYVEFQN